MSFKRFLSVFVLSISVCAYGSLLLLQSRQASSPGCNYSDYGTLLIRFDPRIGATAAQWDDQSGNSNNLVQASGASQFVPTSNQFGTLPGMVTSGSPKYMALTSDLTGLSQFTWFVVYKPASVIYSYILGGPASSPMFSSSNQTNIPAEVYDGTSYADFTDGYSAGVGYLWSFQSGSGPATSKMKRNGSSLVSAGTSGSSWNHAMRVIGRDNFNTGFFYAVGSYGPLLVYDGSLSDVNTAAVTSCLSAEGWF